ncbi:MAG: hypothetical protein ACFFG0_15390 [Candidatus Thorarchaeota archaeon]
MPKHCDRCGLELCKDEIYLDGPYNLCHDCWDELHSGEEIKLKWYISF